MEERVGALDGSVAELVQDGAVAGWLAIQAASFRNLALAKHVGCWIPYTWPDGSIEIEEDYPPFAFVPEILSGRFRDEDRGADYEVRWVTDDRHRELWERYGLLKEPGYYMGLAAEQRRRHR
jgi:hypothetical protein